MDVENISVAKLLLKMSPPVMLALLIQSIYNIADSFFVAKYSAEGLSALSIVCCPFFTCAVNGSPLKFIPYA